MIPLETHIIQNATIANSTVIFVRPLFGKTHRLVATIDTLHYQS